MEMVIYTQPLFGKIKEEGAIYQSEVTKELKPIFNSYFINYSFNQ